MKKLIFLGLSVAALSAFGTTLTDQCANASGSVQVAFSTTLGTIQCGDKQFSNFTNATGTLTGTITISENSATGYELFLKAPTGGITTGFSFGFTVAVDPGVCPTCFISQIQQNMATTQAGNTGQSLPNASTGVNTISGGASFSPGTTTGTTGGQNTTASGLSLTSYTLGFQYNPTAGSGAAGDFLNLDDIITQTPVPEPVSLSLTGLGLLGLGLLGRRRLKA